jgi:hypothetical protein
MEMNYSGFSSNMVNNTVNIFHLSTIFWAFAILITQAIKDRNIGIHKC